MRDEISRRRFLHGTALGLGGVLLGACSVRPESSDTAAVPRPSDSAAGTRTGSAALAHISVQLYTVRELAKQDMAGTLRALAEIGYPEVEFAGYHGHEPAAIRRMLDEARLTAPSAHVAIELIRTEPESLLAAAEVVGHRYLILPWVQLPKTVDAWRGLAGELDRFGRACRDRGIQLAYHNHDFEFVPVEGKLPYEVLVEECDPELVKMQLDLFWAVKAGQDPVAWFERHPGRFPLVHVKDMRDLRGAQEMVEVGTGDIDFGRIFSHAGRAGIVHYVVEHDNPSDPMASVRTSYGNLRRLLG